jgi:hypothetical protein
MWSYFIPLEFLLQDPKNNEMKMCRMEECAIETKNGNNKRFHGP